MHSLPAITILKHHNIDLLGEPLSTEALEMLISYFHLTIHRPTCKSLWNTALTGIRLYVAMPYGRSSCILK